MIVNSATPSITPALTPPVSQTASGDSSTSAAGTPKFDYLKLIVAQMQALNPFDPSSGSNALPEMMQAEELNQIIQLQQTIQKLQATTNLATGAALLGRNVTALTASGGTTSGTVQTVQAGPGGISLVLTSGVTVRLQDVQSIAGA
jgi:flagellar hook assembly protein FlgD